MRSNTFKSIIASEAEVEKVNVKPKPEMKGYNELIRKKNAILAKKK